MEPTKGNDMNKYEIWYFGIIENARKRGTVDGYSELHHILPRSLGGPDHSSNLVELTAREHFICHWLLTKIYRTGEEHWKMLNALRMMRMENGVHQRYHTKITSIVYERLRTEYSALQSVRLKGSANPMYGKTHAEDARSKISEANTGMKLTDEQKLKISESKLGKKREQFSDEWIENLTKANSGENNGMYGKSHSDETRELMRQKRLGTQRSPETIAKIAEANRGKIRPKKHCEHCGKEAPVNVYPRWHGDNCKMNPNKPT